MLKELEVGNEEDIDDDANSTRVDPMVVDDSDRETSQRKDDVSWVVHIRYITSTVQ